MATKVYETEKVSLYSGKELNLRPLKIAVLRDFMVKFEDLGDVADDSAKSLDVIIDCVQIAMRQYAPELSEDRDALEDEIDLPTAYKIIEVGSGIKLNDDDPNQ
jgi:hypothetical protein